MTRFNKPVPSPKAPAATVNFEGAKAFSLTPELQLYSAVCTTMLDNKFYESSDERLERIETLLQLVSLEFACKLAVYTREQMHLRTVSLVLTCLIASKYYGPWVRRTVTRVIQRADELAEILAIFQTLQKRTGLKKLNKLPKALQNGIADAFFKFDEYQFAKYNRAGAVTLKDVIRLTHPKPPTSEHAELGRKILDDSLEVPYTWEVELSKLGQQSFKSTLEKELAFKNKWEDLISSKKMGYMATLRNLRNILDAFVDSGHILEAADFLSNKNQVKRSRQLPFRFWSAYKSLEGEGNPKTSIFLEALNKAIWHSVENVKGFDVNDNVLIAVDNSGSMSQQLTPTLNLYEVGVLLAIILWQKCMGVTFGRFSRDFVVTQLSHTINVLNAVRQIYHQAGYETNGHKVLEYALMHPRFDFTKICMFTDMQLWDYGVRTSRYVHSCGLEVLWSKLRLLKPNVELFIFDLAGYGNFPIQIIRGSGVHLISGWSDKIFDCLDAVRNGESAVKQVEEVEL